MQKKHLIGMSLCAVTLTSLGFSPLVKAEDTVIPNNYTIEDKETDQKERHLRVYYSEGFDTLESVLYTLKPGESVDVLKEFEGKTFSYASEDKTVYRYEDLSSVFEDSISLVYEENKKTVLAPKQYTVRYVEETDQGQIDIATPQLATISTRYDHVPIPEIQGYYTMASLELGVPISYDDTIDGGTVEIIYKKIVQPPRIYQLNIINKVTGVVLSSQQQSMNESSSRKLDDLVPEGFEAASQIIVFYEELQGENPQVDLYVVPANDRDGYAIRVEYQDVSAERENRVIGSDYFVIAPNKEITVAPKEIPGYELVDDEKLRFTIPANFIKSYPSRDPIRFLYKKVGTNGKQEELNQGQTWTLTEEEVQVIYQLETELYTVLREASKLDLTKYDRSKAPSTNKSEGIESQLDLRFLQWSGNLPPKKISSYVGIAPPMALYNELRSVLYGVKRDLAYYLAQDRPEGKFDKPEDKSNTLLSTNQYKKDIKKEEESQRNQTSKSSGFKLPTYSTTNPRPTDQLDLSKDPTVDLAGHIKKMRTTDTKEATTNLSASTLPQTGQVNSLAISLLGLTGLISLGHVAAIRRRSSK